MARPGGTDPGRESLGIEPGASMVWPIALVLRARLVACRVGLLLLCFSHRLETVAQCAALFTGTPSPDPRWRLVCAQRADARLDACGPGHSSPSPSLLSRGRRHRGCDGAFPVVASPTGRSPLLCPTSRVGLAPGQSTEALGDIG